MSAVLVLCISVGLWVAVGTDKPAVDSARLPVVASFYPLYEFTKQVGGTKVQVANMTPTGVEPHDFEPSAKAIAEAQKSALFVYNGGSFEPWATKFVTEYEGIAIAGSQDISLQHAGYHDQEHIETGDDHDHDAGQQGTLDPHYWVDPVLAQAAVNTIRDGLSKADPVNADYYAQNAQKYNQKLAQLDADFKAGLAQCSQRTIVVSHQSMGYIATRYDLHAEAVAGLGPDSEPSAARLAELTQIVRQQRIPYIFFESLVSPRLADTIARETGAQTLVLDPIEGLTDAAQQAGKNYINIQHENLQNLRRALTCR